MNEEYKLSKKAEQDGFHSNQWGASYFDPCNVPPYMGVDIIDDSNWDFAFREDSENALWDYRYVVTYNNAEDKFAYRTDIINNLSGKVMGTNDGVPWDDDAKAAVEMGIRDYYMNSYYYCG